MKLTSQATPAWQSLGDRPAPPVDHAAHTRGVARAAMSIIDALAQELADDPQIDRAALVAALRRRMGYEQADSAWPDEHRTLDIALVGRLAERLARA